MPRFLPIPVNTAAEVRRGLLFMIAGTLMIPSLDAVAKVLGEFHGMPAGVIALGRFGLQTLMVLPFLIAVDGISALRVSHPGLNLLRGVLLGLASFAFFLALKSMPLADAMAIFFVEPMLIILLSGLVLGEKTSWRQIIAVVVGFLGALIVIRPNFVSLGLVACLPLVTAVFVAVYSILSRQLSAGSTPLAMHFYAGVGGTAALAVVMLVGGGREPELAFVVPEGALVWVLLLAVGALATVGHLLFIKAYRLAPASVLAPFGYLEIISATLLGFAIFGDFPAPLDWLGIAIIVASGIYVFLHERNPAEVPSPQPSVTISQGARRDSAGGHP